MRIYVLKFRFNPMEFKLHDWLLKKNRKIEANFFIVMNFKKCLKKIPRYLPFQCLRVVVIKIKIQEKEIRSILPRANFFTHRLRIVINNIFLVSVFSNIFVPQ